MEITSSCDRWSSEFFSMLCELWVVYKSGFQAAISFVAMANRKYIWWLKFQGKLSIGDQQIWKKKRIRKAYQCLVELSDHLNHLIYFLQRKFWWFAKSGKSVKSEINSGPSSSCSGRESVNDLSFGWTVECNIPAISDKNR